MGSLLGILNGPIAGTLSAINDIIGKFVTDPQTKLQASLELTKASNDLTMKLAELDVEWAKTQGDVITTEAKSESWITRNWRPITMLVFVFIVAFNYILSPLFSLQSLPIPPDMWELLKIGLGGYIIGRSAEKTIPAIVDAIGVTRK